MNAGDQVCTFYVGDQYFGVAAQCVQEVIRHRALTRIPLAPREIRGLVNLRGRIVTVLGLRELLALPARATGGDRMNVVLRTDEEDVGLIVDDVDEVISVAGCAFEPSPETLAGRARELISGAYKLPGKLLLLLDTERLLNQRYIRDALGQAGAHAERGQARG